MAGFRREIGTSVEAPQIQVPQATGDDVSDVLNVAAFGLDLYGQYQQRKKIEDQEKLRSILTGKAQEIHSRIVEALDQQDISPAKLEIMTQKLVSGASQSPSERQFLLESIGKLQSSKIFEAAFKAEQDEDSFLTDELKSFDDEIIVSVSRDKDITELSTEEKRRAVVQARKLNAKREEFKAVNEDLSLNPTYAGFVDSTEKRMSLVYEQAGSVLPSLMDKVRRAGGNAELTELLSAAKTNFVSLIEQLKQAQRQDFNMVMKSGDKDLIDRAKVAHENSLKALDDQVEFLNGLDEEQFKSTMRMANKLKQELEIELYETMPEAMRNKEAFGAAYNSLVELALNKNPVLLEDVRKRAKGGILQALGATPEGSAVLSNHFDMAQLRHVFNGKSLASFDEAERDRVAAKRWTTVSHVISDPKSMDALTDKQVSSTAIAMIEVLDAAEEAGDSQSLKNANTLLTSPALERLLQHNSLTDDQKAVITDRVRSSTAKLLEESNLEGFGIRYDASKKEFVASEVKPIKGTSGDPRDVALRRSTERKNRETQEKLKKINQKLKVTSSLMSKYNPAVESDLEARDLIVSFGNVPVTGKLPSFEPEKREAVRQSVSVDEIKKRSSLEEEVRSFSEGVSKTLEQQKQRVQAEQVSEETEIDQEAALRLRVKAFKKQFPEESKHLSDEEIMQELRGGG